MPAQGQVNSLQVIGNSFAAKQKNSTTYNLQPTTSKKGFTLLELMIAISIIAIISSIGMVTYSQSQKLARDSRRKEDLQQIAKALQLYYNDTNSYPFSAVTIGGCTYTGVGSYVGLYCYSNNATTPWIYNLGAGYIGALPKDPSANNGDPNSGTNYGYGYLSPNPAGCSGGQYFMLFTRLENTSDPDRLGANNKPLCPSVVVNNAGGFNANLFIVTSY